MECEEHLWLLYKHVQRHFDVPVSIRGIHKLVGVASLVSDCIIVVGNGLLVAISVRSAIYVLKHTFQTYTSTRFSAQEVEDVARALEIPAFLHTKSRHAFTCLEAFALLCARFWTPAELGMLAMLYNCSTSAISEIVNQLSEFIDDHWAHLLRFDHVGLLSCPNLTAYAAAIHQKGSLLDSVWGFIDCTIRQICRPSRFQREAYSGHKKYHALKFQAIMLPNGMFGHLHGPFGARRNDNFLLEDSGLLCDCAEHAFRDDVPANAPYESRCLQVFGDPAYGTGRHLLSPFAGVELTSDQRQWNASMSSVRQNVEHGFGLVTNQWPFLNAGWKMPVYKSPVAWYYNVGVLLTNARNCMSRNQVVKYFNLQPPLLDKYFHH
jgi:hypothetical protein